MNQEIKTKFRLIYNRLKKRIVEQYYILARKASKKWDKFLHKGHEKMTVMFIPHNEKRIFNFQISKFTISFFIFLFLVVIATSSFAVLKNSETKKKEEDLLMDYKDIHSQIVRFESMTEDVSDTIEDLKPQIEELYAIAVGNDEMEDLWEREPEIEEKELSADEKKLQSLLPDEVNELKEIQKDIINAASTIKTVKSFIDVRSKVINDTPSIVSNPGHITSLFGWRRSPFGFGRDFHTGIDIAAPAGTPIVATAPGKVIMAGWGGGYGNMVRIQHKYGFMTIYGHMSRLNTFTGAELKKGQVIGYVGQTGSSTGNHCHYEIRLGNVAINPYPYMSKMW